MLKRITSVLPWLLICMGLAELLFVTIPFFVQGAPAASFADLQRGLVRHRFLGDPGFAVALIAQTFGYSLLVPLSIVSVVVNSKRRHWGLVILTICSAMPWLVLLPYHRRLVEWLWI